MRRLPFVTRTGRTGLTGLIGFVGLVACSKTNPNYCPEAPLHNCSLVDAPPDTPTGCTAASCTGTAPVCGDNGACRACANDVDCASGVCRTDGSCTDAAAVLYASATGAATACTQADPCALATALGEIDTTRTVIHLDPGTYTTAIAPAQDCTIVGHAAIELASGVVATISAGRTVTLEGLTLRAATNSNGVSGVSIGAGAHATLVQVVVGGTEGAGVTMADGGTLVVSRSSIHDNTGGGLVIGPTSASSLVDITNAFVYQNGGSLSTQNVGGISITAPLLAGSRIDFVTVVDNTANNTATAHAGGIVCDIASFSITNSIIAHNAYGTDYGAASANTFGACQTTVGDLIQSSLDGMVMADAAQHDYHIGPGSLAIDHATATQITVDIDGDPRPQGSGYDTGADEYKP
jgi:hypothetical protein